jgi:hypothetical protein
MSRQTKSLSNKMYVVVMTWRPNASKRLRTRCHQTSVIASRWGIRKQRNRNINARRSCTLFQASAAIYMRCVLFWNFTESSIVIPYRRFGTIGPIFRGSGLTLEGGWRWHSWLRHALQTGRSWVRFLMGSLGFFIDIILPAALWPRDQLSL